tara:strand:- start:1939 stop:2583 length:645 start_codon:yes stop_codon:yes gene_type:complete
MNAASSHELEWLVKHNFKKADVHFWVEDCKGVKFKAIPDLVLWEDTNRKFILIDYKHKLPLNSIGKNGGRVACKNKRKSYEELTRKGYGKGSPKQRALNARRYDWNHSIYQKAAQKNCLQALGNFDVEYWVVDPDAEKHFIRYQTKTNQENKLFFNQSNVRSAADKAGVIMMSTDEFSRRLSEGQFSQIDYMNWRGRVCFTQTGEIVVKKSKGT